MNANASSSRSGFDPKALLDPKNHAKKSKSPRPASTAPATNGTKLLDRSVIPGAKFAPQSNGEDEGDGQQNGSLIENLYRVEQRSDRPAKRQKKEQDNDEESDEDSPASKKKESSSRGRGGGDLSNHMKEEREKAANNQVIDLTEAIDNADDDDVIFIEEKDVEVCLGTIENAQVNAHKVPTPKNTGFQQTMKRWLPMKVSLARRPGTNTHIIGVSDLLGNDFGTIDVRTASVLAPLMDNRKTSNVRLKAHLDARDKKPYEWPGQSISAHMKVSITIYCPKKLAPGIGKLFTQRQVWLRKFGNIDKGVQYYDAQEDQTNAPKTKQKLAASTSRYASGGTVLRTTEQVRQDVFDLLDSLPTSDDLPEMQPPSAIQTSLLKHQRQALHWMIEREKDKTDDPDANDESSLWQKNVSSSGTVSWYHVISGHKLRDEKPEPTRGGILADVMGLGKTLNVLSLIMSTLDAAKEFSKEKPPKPKYEDDPTNLKWNTSATLLLCPLSTIANWEEQIQSHVKDQGLKYIVYHGTNRTDDPVVLSHYDLVITTYSVVAANHDRKLSKKKGNPLMELNWFRVVLDEGHIIREQNTRQSKTTCALPAQRRWVLTGTPVQNRLEDLGALVKFLRIKPFDEPRTFNEYIIAPFKTGDTETIPKLRLLVDSITLRRLKDKLDLPTREEVIEELDMSDAERSFYDFFSQESKKSVNMVLGEKEKLGGRDYSHILKVILRLRMMCAHGSDLLNDEDWNQARGFDLTTAIDLEEEDAKKTNRSRRSAFEIYRMMRDAGFNTCCKCNRLIKSRDVIDQDDDDELGEDTFGYLTNCNQLVCTKCVEQFRSDLLHIAGPDNFGNCPICDTYIHISLYQMTQSELDADEYSLAEMRANPRLARQMGRYSGPHTKVKALIAALEEDNVLSEELPEDEPPIKSVVFSGWTTYLDLIQIALTDNQVGFVRLDGSKSRAERNSALNKFANDPDITVILVSIGAGGLGLNLTAASRVYVMEPQYNPAQEAQSIERVHRLGQRRPVKIVKYIMKGSIEENMLELQQKKKDLANMSLERKYNKFDKEENAKKKLNELKTLFK
ncbi:MAG: hypothetical protein M1831_003180 [Alyxoria varia]|nr:MAG: hypothetical protein M1831_003180 [Alyxoria varia]